MNQASKVLTWCKENPMAATAIAVAVVLLVAVVVKEMKVAVPGGRPK